MTAVGLRQEAMKLVAVNGYTGGHALPGGGIAVPRQVLLLLDATSNSVMAVAAAAAAGAKKWTNNTFTDWIGADPVWGAAEAGVFLPCPHRQLRPGPATTRARRGEIIASSGGKEAVRPAGVAPCSALLTTLP